MGTYFEVWTRPGHPTFGPVLDPPFRESTLHDGVNLRGDGTMQMPNNYDRFDDILLIDGANSASSLVRARNDQTGDIIFEWLPNALQPTSAKNDPYVDVSGQGIKNILTYARTEAYDWDGSDDWACQSCDWIWGGTNILSNWDFESSTVTPKSFEIIVTATGGSFTISDGTDTTTAITVPTMASVIETRLQTDIASINDIVVATAGPSVFVMTLVDPPFGINLSLNVGSLTGGTATITATEEGGLSPSPWTRARALAFGVPKDAGSYDEFRISTAQNHTPGGQYSLLIDPGAVGATSNRNAGAQQVLRVQPGFTYQASLWVYPTSGTDRFRLGLFGIGEEVLAWTNWAGQTLTPNVWNQLTISDVVIPDDMTELIFRIACTNQFPSNPSAFYIDDGEFNEGLQATTIGEIVRLLYDHATDTALRNPIVWEDEANPGTPYLTLDFSDTLDSAGNAWTDSEIRIHIFMRQTLYQVLTQLAGSYGIEFRVVLDDEDAGTWLLQIYDQGSMGTDYTTAASPAIQGGSDDTQRQVRRFLPNTDFLVEGQERVTSRAANTTLRTALGRMETGRIDREAPSEDAVQDAVAEDAADAELTGKTWNYELADPVEEPLTAYVLGDTLTVHDPPEADGPGRLWDVEGVFGSEAETWEVMFLPEAT